MISVKMTPVKSIEKTFKTLEEKFIHDFDNRFGGAVILENNHPFSWKVRSCSKSEIISWVDRWLSNNGDLDQNFIQQSNAFLKNQFKRAQL